MEKHSLACAFTGHRSKYLLGLGQESDEACHELKNILTHEIASAAQKGYTRFFTGMSEGIDIICGELVLMVKNAFPQITLECVMPFIGHAQRCCSSVLDRYERLIHECDSVRNISAGRSGIDGSFKRRNQYLVDNADMLIAAFHISQSGSGQTFRMAQRKGIPIVHINTETLKISRF